VCVFENKKGALHINKYVKAPNYIDGIEGIFNLKKVVKPKA